MAEPIPVCTKVIYGSPDPVRLVEWIDMNQLMGVDRIYIYVQLVNPWQGKQVMAG